jgi:hypothetical protein
MAHYQNKFVQLPFLVLNFSSQPRTIISIPIVQHIQPNTTPIGIQITISTLPSYGSSTMTLFGEIIFIA